MKDFFGWKVLPSFPAMAIGPWLLAARPLLAAGSLFWIFVFFSSTFLIAGCVFRLLGLFPEDHFLQ